jgi:hypothetical protein
MNGIPLVTFVSFVVRKRNLTTKDTKVFTKDTKNYNLF